MTIPSLIRSWPCKDAEPRLPLLHRCARSRADEVNSRFEVSLQSALRSGMVSCGVMHWCRPSDSVEACFTLFLDLLDVGDAQV